MIFVNSIPFNTVSFQFFIKTLDLFKINHQNVTLYVNEMIIHRFFLFKKFTDNRINSQ